jgi:hypothetical protein
VLAAFISLGLEPSLEAQREPFGPQPIQEGPAFTYKLGHEDGTPADPPMFRTIVPTWRAGDTIPLGADPTLRVVAIRDNDADQPPALVVEPVHPR